MKRMLLVGLILVMALALPVWADDQVDGQVSEQVDELSFFDIKGSAGFTLGYLDLDLSGLNKQIKGTYPELSNGMMVFGSSNFMGFKEGLRFGSSWFIGTKSESGDNNALSKLILGFGGMDVGYGKVLHEQVDVTVGGLIGIGTYDLTLRERLLDEENATEPNQIHLTNYFFTVGPKVTLDYYVNDWCAVRGIAGYVYGIGKKSWLDVKTRTDAIHAQPLKGALVGLDFSIVY